MDTLKLTSAGVTAAIETTKENIGAIVNDDFTRHYLPDVIFEGTRPDIVVRESEGLERVSRLEYPVINLRKGLDHRSFVVSAEYLLERARQEKHGICTLNSSSVHYDGRGVVFYGAASNLGKSTFALDLVANGFQHYSDEKTLIDFRQGRLVGGSRSVPLRKKSLRKRLGGDQESGFHAIESDFSGVWPLAEIFILPHYDNGLQTPRIDRLDDLDLFWGLSGEFSRRIRGTSRYIDKFNHQLPSIDTDELTDWRVKALKAMVSERKGFYFQGNSRQLVDFIKKEMGIN